MTLFLPLETFFNSVLVGTRKCRENKLAGIRMARMDRQVIALRHNVNDPLEVAEIQMRLDALRVQIKRKVDKVDVSCPFTIPKQATFDAVRSSKDSELGRCDTRAYLNVRKLNLLE